jgi:hypothetical protein
MSKTMNQLNKEKVAEHLEKAGMSYREFAKDNGIDPKTFKKAMEGWAVRETTAQKIAKGFKTDLSALVVDKDKERVANTKIRLDLRVEQITEGADVNESFVQRGSWPLRDRVCIAYPANADQLVRHIGQASIHGNWNPIEDSDRPPKPYFHVHRDVIRGPELIDSLKAVNSALEARNHSSTSAMSLGEFIESLETEDSVLSALKQLNKAGYHILSTVLRIALNDGHFYEEYLNYANYKVPVLVIANTAIASAEIIYRTLGEEDPFEDIVGFNDDGSFVLAIEVEPDPEPEPAKALEAKWDDIPF